MGVPLLIRADAEAAHHQVVVPPADAGGRRQPIEKEEKKGIAEQTKNHRGRLWFKRADLRHRLVPFNAYEVS